MVWVVAVLCVPSIEQCCWDGDGMEDDALVAVPSVRVVCSGYGVHGCLVADDTSAVVSLVCGNNAEVFTYIDGMWENQHYMDTPPTDHTDRPDASVAPLSAVPVSTRSCVGITTIRLASLVSLILLPVSHTHALFVPSTSVIETRMRRVPLGDRRPTRSTVSLWLATG